MDWKNIVKMSTLPQAIYRFKAISIKIPMTFFTEIEPPKIPSNQSKRYKSKAGYIMFPVIKQHYKAIVIKTVQY